MPDALNPGRVQAGARLRELGWVLPKPPTPLGNYVEVHRVGALLFVSGTIPAKDGKLQFAGRLGKDLTVEQGREAAGLAAMNSLALVHEHLGSLDKVKVVKLIVLMVTTETFSEHPAVGDGASNVFAQLFGPEAAHVRVVYGVQSMPLGAPVMVDAVFEVE
jgi:enamine deaminase RidA (YjgF/YER057c/UK114 family)